MSDLPDQWRMSSYTDGAQCVQVGERNGRVYLRDDENPDAVVNMSRGAFDAFAKGVAAGEFNDYR